MKSIKDIYKIGVGPSSSHTMGPQKAAAIFNDRYPHAASFEVTLYGSLAATGKGHMTDVAIIEALRPVAPVKILWEPTIFLPFHPNGMKFKALYAEAGDARNEEWTVYSVGGGALSEGEGATSLLASHTSADILRLSSASVGSPLMFLIRSTRSRPTCDTSAVATDILATVFGFE